MTIWKCYYERRGDHVHCRLFAGPSRGALGLCGNITFRLEEFTEWTRIRKVIGMQFLGEERAEGTPPPQPVVFDENLGDILRLRQ